VLLQQDGITVLMCAAAGNHLEILRLLLLSFHEETQRLELNAQDRNGNSALYYAIENGHVEVVKLLLKCKDIIINATNKVQIKYLFIFHINHDFIVIGRKDSFALCCREQSNRNHRVTFSTSTD